MSWKTFGLRILKSFGVSVVFYVLTLDGSESLLVFLGSYAFFTLTEDQSTY